MLTQILMSFAVHYIYKQAAEIAAKVLPGCTVPTIVVGSDTIVDMDGVILEKPRSSADAAAMLSALSGRQHLVHSGVAIYTSSTGLDKPATCFYETTTVEFKQLTPQEIEAYIATGDPMDKAGSYGIQSVGGQFVVGVRGCHFNVMGFPMSRFSIALAGLIEQGAV
jgi:septum formation protein